MTLANGSTTTAWEAHYACFKSNGGEGATGNYAGFYDALAATGLDGIFTDDPALAARQ